MITRNQLITGSPVASLPENAADEEHCTRIKTKIRNMTALSSVNAIICLLLSEKR